MGDSAEREATFQGSRYIEDRSRYIEDDVAGNPAAGEERVQDDSGLDGSGLNATGAATAFGNEGLDSDPDMIHREGGRA